MTAETDAQPLWLQVLNDLRARLADGEFVERFPRDADLIGQYKVSRYTVREAVRRLQAEGLLERYPGRGSFVVARPIEQPVGSLYSLFRSIERTGAKQQSIVRALEERRDDRAEAMLNCRGESLVYLERVRLADDLPIALDCSWMPFAVAGPLLDVDFGHTALYEELAERCGVQLNGGWEQIHPALADRLQSRLLDISEQQPVFSIERLGLSDDRPIEWRHGVVRGDRFTFVSRWSSDQVDTALERKGAPAG